ncbi:small integral membrane protein 5 isoform X1 [Eubalaena glacialis]|uniref:small integral membrane protein 5 isoform X1 n=1 Tax=Eubalaena glacialis TaxID=27606 RepID=UPI002A59B76D|nr:small integral membrane protein 5 isoform X1 [Eubalaena glacialis]
MAASNLALEMRSIGERLLHKLQTLPQAEPVEIVAFSVLVIFTGNGSAGHQAPQMEGAKLWGPARGRSHLFPDSRVFLTTKPGLR